MMRFADFLLEDAKKKQKVKDWKPSSDKKNYKDNIDFINTTDEYKNTTNMTASIRNLVFKFRDALLAFDKDIISNEETNLRYMKSLIDKYSVPVPERNINWIIHEEDVVKGINTLFSSGFFIRSKNVQDSPLIVTDLKKSYHAEQHGGSKLADVHVTNPVGKDFYVECKLNLQTAEYFKFTLKIQNQRLIYDHSFHLEGKVSKDKEQQEQLNRLFTEKINLNAFMDEILNGKEINAYWKAVLNNIKETVHFISTADEFKDFYKQHKVSMNFPEGFKDIAAVFDIYCKYYIDKYNSLIEDMFKLIDVEDTDLNAGDYKIKSRSKAVKIEKGTVFSKINSLLEKIKEIELESGRTIVLDDEKLQTLAKQIKIIEVKFFTMLKANGKDAENFNDLNQLDNLDKVKYFFKMFVSTVGHRNIGTQPFVDEVTDKLGNMQLCPEYVYDGTKLAQMITDYYVQKDHCAYIQIDDTILQFDKHWNPLNLPDLPIFKDVANKFIVKFTVADSDLSIHLDIRLMELNESGLQNKKIMSFKEKDNTYIANVLKNVVIKVD